MKTLALPDAKNWRAWATAAAAGASLDLARRSGMVMAATPIRSALFEVVAAGVVLLLCMAVACRCLSRDPGQCLSRVADSAWAAILASSIALTFPSTARWLWIVGLAVWLVLALASRPSARPALALKTALGCLLLVCAWRRFYPSWFEFFETGQSLSIAQMYGAGARPYLDVAPIHGWGSDGGFDAFLFRHLGTSLRLFLWHESAGSVLALLAMIAYSIVCLGPIWGAWAALIAVVVCPGFISRQALAFAALACLARGMKTRSASMALSAGVLAALEVFYSFEYGLVVLAGAILGFATELAANRWARAPDGPAASKIAAPFALGVAGGAAPFLLILAAQGSLTAFLRSSFLETPKWAETVWGLPAGSLWSALPFRFLGRAYPEVHCLFFGFALSIAASVLMIRAAGGRLGPVDRAMFVALSAGIASLRPMLGRLDEAHVARYGVLAVVPLTWSVMRAWRSGSARFVLTGVLVAGIAVSIHPRQVLTDHIDVIEGSARERQSFVPVSIPGSGGARLPAYDAQYIEEFRAYVDRHLGPGETFFDFSDQPTLYFVAGRQPPVPYMTVQQYESPERQREVLRDLERLKPPMVILPTPPYGALDGVSNDARAPLVARYLEEHYRPDGHAGVWLVGRRRADRRGQNVYPGFTVPE
jgi:hypothetical protein